MKSTGEEIDLQYMQSHSSPQFSSTTNSPTPIDNKVILKRYIYWSLRFGVSDQFYHELSMTCPSLPRCMISIIYVYSWQMLPTCILKLGLTW